MMIVGFLFIFRSTLKLLLYLSFNLMEKIVVTNEQHGIQYESYTNNGRGKKGF
jgi:hypothetical protein